MDNYNVLTTVELASFLKTKPATILRMVRQGEIPHRKVGRGYMYSLNSVLEWLKGVEEEVQYHTTKKIKFNRKVEK